MVKEVINIRLEEKNIYLTPNLIKTQKELIEMKIFTIFKKPIIISNRLDQRKKVKNFV